MAWREQVAWLTLGGMLIAYGIYFPMAATPGRSTLGMLWLFGVVTGLQAIAVAGVSAALAIRAGAEARSRADERDRAIGRRGAGAGYFVLMVGVILVGVVLPFGGRAGWAIVNPALFVLVIAEGVRQAVVILSYRRGWHG